MREITDADIAAVVVELNLGEDLRGAVATALRNARSNENPNVAASGTQNLLDQPEFHDLRKVRSILRIIEEQKTLYDLVADSINDEGPTVKIGRELGSDDITECSVVTVPYRFSDQTVGVLAIMGPRRMPYARLMALAGGTAQSLNKHFDENERR